MSLASAGEGWDKLSNTGVLAIFPASVSKMCFLALISEC